MFEERTELKEKRNGQLWIAWIILTIVFSLSFPNMFLTEDKSIDIDQKVLLSAILFCFISIVYRVLTFALNYFLAKIINKRFKIQRLEGRVSPIYKVQEYYKDFYVSKYVAGYTELDLEWSVPFSVLFLEQEYIKEKEYPIEKSLKNIKSLKSVYETTHAEEMLKYSKGISAKTLKQQKINKLNKTFNENYL